MKRVRIVKGVQINPDKIDHANRLITTQLMMVNDADTQGDRISAPEITKALDSYMLTIPRVVGRQHKQMTSSYPVDMHQDDEGNLHVTTKVVDDADWADIQTEKITGKSWAGWADSEPAGDGTNWLSNILMDEYSYVDYPAVQTANFKSEDGEDEEESLVKQLAAGAHSWRRREQGSKGGDGMSFVDKVKSVLMKLNILEPINKSDTSADNEGREIKQGGTLDMSEEQIKELLGEFKTAIVAEFDERFKALGNEAVEPDDAGVGDGEAIELSNQITELHDELGKLGDAFAKSISELTEVIKTLPLASGKQNFDGSSEDEETEFEPAGCTR